MSALSFLKKPKQQPVSEDQKEPVSRAGEVDGGSRLGTQPGAPSKPGRQTTLEELAGKSARNPLIRPHLTEKSERLAETGTYVFIVDRKATKAAIRRAVAERYRVGVKRVRVIVMPASAHRKGGRVTRKRLALKKAFVTLEKGQKLVLTSV